MQNKFSNHKVFIMPNYPDKSDLKWETQPFDKDFICLGFYKGYSDIRVAINLKQAKFIVESLKEIIAFAEEQIEKKLKKDDSVRIINGYLRGLIGKILRITDDNKLVVHVHNEERKLVADVLLNYDDVVKL